MHRFRFASAGAALALLTAAGCAGGGGALTGSLGAIGPGTVGYEPSNIMAKSGYSETVIAPDRYRIQIRGPAATTSRERLEKIAAARAAEIGRTGRLGYFRLEGAQIGMECEKFRSGGKYNTGEKGRALAYAVLTVEAAYSKQATDQSFQNSKNFDALRAAVDQPDAAATPAVDPAAAAQCS
ncbi:MAG: hypothetical protein AB7S70_04470 [Hyphomicrobium sp.]